MSETKIIDLSNDSNKSGQKECTICHQTKSIKEFYIIRPRNDYIIPYYRGNCKSCHKQTVKKNKEERKKSTPPSSPLSLPALLSPPSSPDDTIKSTLSIIAAQQELLASRLAKIELNLSNLTNKIASNENSK